MEALLCERVGGIVSGNWYELCGIVSNLFSERTNGFVCSFRG